MPCGAAANSAGSPGARSACTAAHLNGSQVPDFGLVQDGSASSCRSMAGETSPPGEAGVAASALQPAPTQTAVQLPAVGIESLFDHQEQPCLHQRQVQTVPAGDFKSGWSNACHRTPDTCAKCSGCAAAMDCCCWSWASRLGCGSACCAPEFKAATSCRE